MGRALSGGARHPTRDFVHRPPGGGGGKTFSGATGPGCGREVRAGNRAAGHGGRFSQRHSPGGRPTGGLAGVEWRFAGAGAIGRNGSIALPILKLAGAILGVPMPDASRYGTILQDPKGELAGFNEKKPGAGVINAGVYLFRTPVIGLFPDKTPLSFETGCFSGVDCAAGYG